MGAPIISTGPGNSSTQVSPASSTGSSAFSGMSMSAPAPRSTLLAAEAPAARDLGTSVAVGATGFLLFAGIFRQAWDYAFNSKK